MECFLILMIVAGTVALPFAIAGLCRTFAEPPE